MSEDHPTRVRISRTGQDKCWDTRGRELPCAGTGQDGAIRAGHAPAGPRFTDNDDGTVSDNLTGLIWLQDANPFGEVSWEEGLAKTKCLSSGKHGLSDESSEGDWRMPNIRELLSLIDYGTSAPIIPRGHPFNNVQEALYWTSSSLTPAPLLAWMITLGIGPTVFVVKSSPCRLWPVRGNESRVAKTGQKMCFDGQGRPITSPKGTGQDGELQVGVPSPQQRFTDNQDGTITDNLTELIWLKNANAFGLRTWDQALALCNSLANGEAGLKDSSKPGDWHLPNIREIESLVDYNNVGPCLPIVDPKQPGYPFEGVRPSSYWTSTSVAGAPTEAMFLILGVGPSIFESKEHPFFVWPVRTKHSSYQIG